MSIQRLGSVGTTSYQKANAAALIASDRARMLIEPW
jgi:hypothetical protein